MATSTVMEGRKAKAAKPTTAMFEVQARAMLENVPINVMWADRDLNIRYMNAASVRTLRTIQHLLSVKVEDMIGSSIDIFHKDAGRVRKLLTSDKNLPHSARMQLGTEELELIATAIYDEQGNYLGPMVTWDVITKKVRLEEENHDYAGQVAAMKKTQIVVEYGM